MAKEIERKFLVKDTSFIEQAELSYEIAQGYISRRPEGTVRIRVKGDRGYITVKGINSRSVRDEWEYEIPADDARSMIENVCEGNVIIKTRYIVRYKNHTWEVDVFHGMHKDLIVAEVELQSADETVMLPPFVGEEVTGDERYYNSSL